jgi:hypothetical protein
VANSQHEARKRSETRPHHSTTDAASDGQEGSKSTDVPDFFRKSGRTLMGFQVERLGWLTERCANGDNVILADEASTARRVILDRKTLITPHGDGSRQDRLGHQASVFALPLSTAIWTVPGDCTDLHYLNGGTAIQTWAHELNVVCYIGAPESRQVIRDFEIGILSKPRIAALLTTYESVTKDFGLSEGV